MSGNSFLLEQLNAKTRECQKNFCSSVKTICSSFAKEGKKYLRSVNLKNSLEIQIMDVEDVILTQEKLFLKINEIIIYLKSVLEKEKKEKEEEFDIEKIRLKICFLMCKLNRDRKFLDRFEENFYEESNFPRWITLSPSPLVGHPLFLNEKDIEYEENFRGNLQFDDCSLFLISENNECEENFRENLQFDDCPLFLNGEDVECKEVAEKDIECKEAVEKDSFFYYFNQHVINVRENIRKNEEELDDLMFKEEHFYDEEFKKVRMDREDRINLIEQEISLLENKLILVKRDLEEYGLILNDKTIFFKKIDFDIFSELEEFRDSLHKAFEDRRSFFKKEADFWIKKTNDSIDKTSNTYKSDIMFILSINTANNKLIESGVREIKQVFFDCLDSIYEEAFKKYIAASDSRKRMIDYLKFYETTLSGETPNALECKDNLRPNMNDFQKLFCDIEKKERELESVALDDDRKRKLIEQIALLKKSSGHFWGEIFFAISPDGFLCWIQGEIFRSEERVKNIDESVSSLGFYTNDMKSSEMELKQFK